ncbi:MAG: hypothetical protein ACXVB1_14790 [Pseudobdellovibrionaceae bacterium]
MKLLFHLLFFANLIGASLSEAANHYVKAGATGLGNGIDWTNAYIALPANLVRGDTYYISSGNYPSHTFEDPLSGSAIITIKKATSSDHGTETGWQAAYGTGQAVFNSILTFNTGNYIFDGQTRNESNWFDGTAYGFQVYHNNTLDQNIVIGPNGGPAANNITIQYVYINAPYHDLPTTQTIRQCAIDTDTYGGPQHSGLVFRRMYVYGSNNVWFLRSTDGAIVEYSASYGAASNGMNHGEVVNLYYSGVNAIIRYNQFKEEFIGDGGTALVAITDGGDGLQFYGNVADHFQVGDASVGFDGYGKGYTSNHNRVYNNTFANSVGYNAGTAWGGGVDNLVYNNLFINCPIVSFDSLGLGSADDYNGFSDSNARGEMNAVINIPTSVFSNYSGGDYRLASAVGPGYALAAPYNVDMLGVLRGASGMWDLGAFEYGGSAPSPTVILTAPLNLKITP